MSLTYLALLYDDMSDVKKMAKLPAINYTTSAFTHRLYIVYATPKFLFIVLFSRKLNIDYIFHIFFHSPTLVLFIFFGLNQNNSRVKCRSCFIASSMKLRQLLNASHGVKIEARYGIEKSLIRLEAHNAIYGIFFDDTAGIKRCHTFMLQLITQLRHFTV